MVFSASESPLEIPVELAWHDSPENRRASFLAQAGMRLLSTSLDAEQTLRQLAELVVPAVADSCVVSVLDEATGTLRVAVRAWNNADKEAVARELDEHYPVALDAAALSRVLHTGKPELHAMVADAELESRATTPEHLDLLRVLGLKSSMSAPLVARQRILGVVTLGLMDSSRRYEVADLDMLEQLAVSAGLAVENARLYQYEQNARATIERAANRMRRLQTIATDLASTLAYDDVAKAVIDHGVAAVGASRGAIWELDECAQTMRLIRAQNAVAAQQDLVAVALDAEGPVHDAFRSRAPIFIATRDEFERRFVAGAAHLPQVSSFACLPLDVQGKAFGVLMFAFDGRHVFDADERAFLVLIGDHCAQAFSRASTYAAEQRARSEMALLYGLVDAVNRATSLAEVYEASLEVVQRALKVTRSSILLFDDDGVVRFKSSRGLSDAYRAAVEGHSPWSRDAKDPVPIFLTDSERDEGAAAYRVTFRNEGIRALGFFPLVHHGKLLGKFMVYSEEPRVFTDDEVRLAQTIAGQISQAVVRKRTEADAVSARASAEYASRMKDEFLAVVSHELRTPLASIMGWASILQTERRSDPAVLARGIDVIARNARSQARIIEDILDVSRIIRGKLRLDPHPIELVPILVETIEALRTSATAKAIDVELDAEDDLFFIEGDPDRLRQVVWNLVSNAIKFTPSSGKVRVGLRRELGAVLLDVSDTGVGIAPDLLPYVFDRFRQADSTSTRRHGGLGLGLSIVRHIVELHGGQVTVQSRGPGEGSTFVARFPVRALAAEASPPAEAIPRGALGDLAGSSKPTVTPLGDFPDLAGVRVLVVDDEPDAREMLMEALALHGAVVEVAASAGEAVEVLQTFQPKVLVTDIGMPDDDGYALLRRVRALPGAVARVPAVAVTAYARDEDARKARAAGFHSHVAKPTRPEVLAEAVVRALDSAGPAR